MDGTFFSLYILFHLPALILLFMGLGRLVDRPKNAKILLIIAGVYFLIGAGICGAILNGI